MATPRLKKKLYWVSSAKGLANGYGDTPEKAYLDQEKRLEKAIEHKRHVKAMADRYDALTTENEKNKRLIETLNRLVRTIQGNECLTEGWILVAMAYLGTTDLDAVKKRFGSVAPRDFGDSGIRVKNYLQVWKEKFG